VQVQTIEQYKQSCHSRRTLCLIKVCSRNRSSWLLRLWLVWGWCW